MTIIYDFDKDGAFIACDTQSRRTVYAYPTSPCAVSARTRAPETARKMVNQENSYGSWRDIVKFREKDEERITAVSERNARSR